MENNTTMKGKLILTRVKEPEERMKVVYRNKVLVIESTYLFKGGRVCTLKQIGAAIYTPLVSLYELQQIAVEYEIVKGSTNPDSMSPNPKYAILPLHSDNYETALPLIGKEVEFDIDSIDKWSGIGTVRRVDYACIILSTPIMYTEEQVKEKINLFHSWFWKAIKSVEFNWSTKNGAPSPEDFWNDEEFWNKNK